MTRTLLFMVIAVVAPPLVLSHKIERTATPLAAGSPQQTRPQAASAAPATVFGKLVRVERRNKTIIRMIHPRGARNELQRAEEGKIFVILHFVGKASVDLSDGSERLLVKFAASLGAGFVRTTDQSWLTDGDGQKYEKGLIVTSPLKRQLAFEVLADATDLTWHDGKQTFQPHFAHVADETKKTAKRLL